jgi:hypothetical protein
MTQSHEPRSVVIGAVLSRYLSAFTRRNPNDFRRMKSVATEEPEANFDRS